MTDAEMMFKKTLESIRDHLKSFGPAPEDLAQSICKQLGLPKDPVEEIERFKANLSGLTQSLGMNSPRGKVLRFLDNRRPDGV